MPNEGSVMDEIRDVLTKTGDALSKIGSVLEKTVDRLDDHDILVGVGNDLKHLVIEVQRNNTLAAQSRDDHEQRLRDLEARINWLWGALGIGVAGSVAISKLLG